MSNLFDNLKDAPRLLMEAKLKPLQGDRFQPTGFADLGPARYQSSCGESMLLVESAQSVANWLEAMIWDPPQLGRLSSAAAKLAEPVKDLPYIVVKRNDGSALTNSLIEAHRLNSPYILSDEAFKKMLSGELRSSLERSARCPIVLTSCVQIRPELCPSWSDARRNRRPLASSPSHIRSHRSKRT